MAVTLVASAYLLRGALLIAQESFVAFAYRLIKNCKRITWFI